MEEGNSIWVSHVDGQAPKQIPAASYRVYISRNLELKMELRHKKFKFRHSQIVQGMPSWHIKCLTDHLKKTIFKLKTYCHFIIFAWLTVKQALGGDHEFNYSAKKKTLKISIQSHFILTLLRKLHRCLMFTANIVSNLTDFLDSHASKFEAWVQSLSILIYP